MLYGGAKDTSLCSHPICHMGLQKATKHIQQYSDRRYGQFYDRAAFIASGLSIRA